jgi:hypothetical protein
MISLNLSGTLSEKLPVLRPGKTIHSLLDIATRTMLANPHIAAKNT